MRGFTDGNERGPMQQVLVEQNNSVHVQGSSFHSFKCKSSYCYTSPTGFLYRRTFESGSLTVIS